MLIGSYRIYNYWYLMEWGTVLLSNQNQSLSAISYRFCLKKQRIGSDALNLLSVVFQDCTVGVTNTEIHSYCAGTFICNLGHGSAKNPAEYLLHTSFDSSRGLICEIGWGRDFFINVGFVDTTLHEDGCFQEMTNNTIDRNFVNESYSIIISVKNIICK